MKSIFHNLFQCKCELHPQNSGFDCDIEFRIENIRNPISDHTHVQNPIERQLIHIHVQPTICICMTKFRLQMLGRFLTEDAYRIKCLIIVITFKVCLTFCLTLSRLTFGCKAFKCLLSVSHSLNGCH